MDETKKAFSRKEIEENGIIFIRETIIKNPFLKKIILYSKLKNKN
jgi:hypothetical protein